MELIIWIIIGGVAGWLAQRILGKVGPFGMVGDIILGLAGAVVGGWVMSAIGGDGTGGLAGSFVTALVGALILVFVVGRVVKRR